MKTKLTMSIVAIAFAMLMVGSVYAWVGQSLTIPAVTNSGLYKSTIYGYQTQTVVWNPYKTYVTKDWISVVPTGKVKANTDYTLVEFVTKLKITCLNSGVSSSQGYLNLPSVEYAWTAKKADAKVQQLMIVPTSQLDCSAGKFVSYKASDILFGLPKI